MLVASAPAAALATLCTVLIPETDAWLEQQKHRSKCAESDACTSLGGEECAAWGLAPKDAAGETAAAPLAQMGSSRIGARACVRLGRCLSSP
eukprot:CAMPEP_0119368376 /NCGR_PEP_ID=MMETSP1334-20130426/15043_1 /TAXON_ID=127549 /ORGANISM="Calcidiscus leptoporus, Strain RCC1130" /LENGTH=91 /DNA_ID=CAMNT_0007385001 /DNA_START=1 /DNA_END=273 /DNA_ORIENTATION=+